jgi:hypothetical protein
MSSDLLGQIIGAIVKAPNPTSAMEKTISLYDCQGLKKSIERVEEQNNRIIAAHFKAAEDHLRYAQKAASYTNRRKYLENAKDEFIQASHVTDSPYGTVHAKLMVATCFWFLAEKDNTLDACKEAYNGANKIIRDLNSSISNPFNFFSLDTFKQKRDEVNDFLINTSSLIRKVEGAKTYYLEVDGKRRKLKPKCPSCGWTTVLYRDDCPICGEEIIADSRN